MIPVFRTQGYNPPDPFHPIGINVPGLIEEHSLQKHQKNLKDTFSYAGKIMQDK